MRCILFTIFENTIAEQRLVFDVEKEAGGEAAKMLKGRGLSAGNRDVAGEYLNRVAAGQETGYQTREMRPTNVPIKLDAKTLDGFPTDDGSKPEHGLRKILKYKLDHMKITPEVRAKYGTMLSDFPEAMLRKAIVENMTEAELLDEYEDQLDEFADDSEDFIDWYKSKPVTEANPNLTAIPGMSVQTKHRDEVAAQLANIEQYYRNRFEEVHSIGRNDYTSEGLDFVNEVQIPFYREYFLNGAIIQRQPPQLLAETYAERLKELFRNCITEDTGALTAASKRQMQEAADRSGQDKVDRQSNGLWWSSLREMNTIVLK